MRTRILLVAHNVALRARLARLLKAAGHSVELAENAAHARRTGLSGFTVAVVAPDGFGPDAKALISELDVQGAKVLTLGTEPGSLDPSDETGLLARIAEATHSPPVADGPEPVLCFGGFRLDLAAHVLTDNGGNEVPLTRGEFNLLREFVQRPGRVLSRDHLLQALAGRDAESFDRSIDMSMVRLRRKIEADPKRPNLIITVPGSGYRFAAKLTIHTGIPAEPPPSFPAPMLSLPTARQRRQLTIMQCVLAGPAFIAARPDPEDLQRLLTAYRERCQTLIASAGGMIDRLLSDGVLAYFGYPEADEHQAERAIRAGLKLVETVGRIDTGGIGSLQARVGVATGLAVVGGKSAGEPAALGEAAHLAAGLAAKAEPDSVLISASTRQLVGGLFELRARDPITMEGVNEPLQAWQVTEEAASAIRFEALRGVALAPWVGREEELELLLRRWEQAKAGSGKVVLISGEPGIGKSRLTRAFQDAVTGERPIELRYFCSPHHQDSALHPHIAQLERAAGISHCDTNEEKLAKLDVVLAKSDASEEAVALIAELISIETDQRARIQRMMPQARRDQTLAALMAQLAPLAARQPVLIIYEDLHWIDPSSSELLDRIVEELESLPALLVLTFRPEFRPPWIEQANATSLALTRLNRHHTVEMIAGIAGGAGLRSEIAQEIAARTDGVPLFIEEVTKAVVESGPKAAEALSSIPPPMMGVPATLHASLISRLDRLGPAARDIAQKGAVIGRDFPYELIATIADRPESELRELLGRLTSAGLLFARGTPPRSNYLFKHALVQDIAYETLLRDSRRRLHARIVEVLENQFSDIAASQPELLARHCTEAGLLEKAAEMWGKAGQRSLERSALVEAIEQLTRALNLIATLPSTPVLRREQITLQVALIDPLLHVKGYAASETRAATERARLLIEQAEAAGEVLEDPLLLFSVLYGFWVANLVAVNGDAMRQLGMQYLAMAEQHGSTATRMIGHRLAGMSFLHTGDIAEGRAHLDRAIALYNPAQHRSLATRFGHDSGTAILCFRSLALWLLGYPEAALKDTSDALRFATEIGQATTLMYAVTVIPFTHFQCGDYITANTRLDEALALADEKGTLIWKAWAVMQRGCVMALEGRASDAVHMINSGIALWRSTGSTLWLPLYLSYLAGAYAELDRLEDALRYNEEAVTAILKTKETIWEAEAYRLTGEIARKSAEPEAAKAEASFQHALAIARAQQAKSWELRTATSYARLMRDQGRVREAYKLLAPIYGWFTEGFGTKDLIEAKALLDELVAQSSVGSIGENPVPPAGRD